MSKKINCKWCGMGHPPKADGNHWIVKSIIPARIDIKECAYHKVGEVSPICSVTEGNRGHDRT
jgi:hypothetical protein